MADEIIMVDDGSTDGTREILTRLETEYDDVRVILHERNQGKGKARSSPDLLLPPVTSCSFKMLIWNTIHVIILF